MPDDVPGTSLPEHLKRLRSELGQTDRGAVGVGVNDRIGVVIALAFAGLYVLFAFKARAGRNWARIALTVLTALGVLALVIGGFSVVGILSTVVSVVAVVLLFLPASNQHFAAQQARL
jgi:hypothetical protein